MGTPSWFVLSKSGARVPACSRSLIGCLRTVRRTSRIALLHSIAKSATDSSGEPRPVLQNLSGGVIARGAGDPSTGMGTGSAEIQAFDRRPVAGPTWHGAEDEGLVQRHLAVIDVPFRQTEPLLQIDGSEDLPAEDQSLQAGHVVLEDGRDTLGEFFAFGVPAATPQRVWCILDLDRHHVL